MMARDQVHMVVRQQPQRAQVVQENNPKNRKPIDPPPIIQLKYNDSNDPTNAQWLVSPRTFMMVTLINAKDADEYIPGKYLIGQTVSSLHRLKDIDNKDGGFFVFGDISARNLGTYKLRFSLFDTNKDTEEVMFLGSVDSEHFPVLPQRDFGSMSESTHLTRTFSDQGVKLRVRKDNRAMSSIGTKRSFNASPPDTSSPSMHPGIYGGAVQDHHYSTSGQSPAAKRHRSGSEYEIHNVYQSLGSTDSYTSALPTSQRSWSGHEPQRVPSSYSHQQSPMGMPMMNRSQTMGVQAPQTWQSIQQNSALPSPTHSLHSQQQPAYPAVSQTSSTFGDTVSASSIPRHYYSQQGYAYPSVPSQGQYSGQPAGDSHSQYPDLQTLGSSIPDSTGMGSAANQGYSQGYLQSNNIFATEAPEVGGAYAYMSDQGQRI